MGMSERQNEKSAGKAVALSAISSRRAPAGVTIASSIEFDKVDHFFGHRQTLNKVSILASPGEVLCLLGPSGSGKTTLLRLAAGLTEPARGRVLIDGREVSRPGSVVPPERRGVGLVFQDFALFPHLTVLQNVEFGLIQLGKGQRRQHALRMLETVGIAHEAAKYPHALSGGEQQRVALARALAPKPGILLMDEPFSGLDARLRDSVRSETLSLLQSTRSTVLLVTHDPEEALTVADKIALMRGGEIVQSGTCDDLYNHPNSLFSARFFTQLNILPAERTGDRVETPFGTLPITDPALRNSDVPLCVCVRPADFRVEPVETFPNNTEAGRVYLRNRRFLGEVEQLEVVHQPTGIHLDLRCAPDTVLPGTSQLSISLDPGKAMIFAVES